MVILNYDPKVTLHSLCSDLEIPSIDVPESDITRVRLTSRTSNVHAALRFDPDNTGLQYSVPLAKIRQEDFGSVAVAAIQDPPRGITPLLRNDGLFGIQGVIAPLPANKVDFESACLDAFGRITTYVDEDLPKIIQSGHLII